MRPSDASTTWGMPNAMDGEINLVLVDELPRSVNVTAERNVCKLSNTTIPVVHFAHKLPRTSRAIRDPSPPPLPLPTSLPTDKKKKRRGGDWRKRKRDACLRRLTIDGPKKDDDDDDNLRNYRGTREEYRFASVIAASVIPRVAIESISPTHQPVGWLGYRSHSVGWRWFFGQPVKVPVPPCLSLLFRPSSHSREVEESERSRPVDDISSIFTTHEMIYHEIRTIVF